MLVLITGLFPTSPMAAESPFLALTLAPDTPPSRIVTVGDNGTEESATRINLTAANETISINSISVQRVDGKDADFAWIALFDVSGNASQIGTNQVLVEGNTTIALPPEYTWLIQKNATKTLEIKVRFTGIQTESITGAISGNAPKIGLTRIKGIGAASGQIIDISTNVSGNPMVLRKSKPIIAAASLPNKALSTGEKVLYRWTITADQKGDISWQDITFEVSGSIQVGGEKFFIGSKTEIPALTDAVYIQSANDTLKKLILAESFRIFDVGTGEQIPGIVQILNLPDKALISFNAVGLVTGIRGDVNGDGKVDALDITKLERIIAGLDPLDPGNQAIPAGATRTYEIRGNILYSGQAGDVMMTRIPKGADNSTFGWSDGAAEATDYLVPGLPTAHLSLTK